MFRISPPLLEMETVKKILIVDDDPLFREGLHMVLTKVGFDVVEAASGEDAIKEASTSPFDVALVDFLMPDMDGLEVLHELKKINPRSRFILMTAFATIEHAVRAIKKGASDYIAKPVPFEQLIAVVNRVLAESQFDETTRIDDLDQALLAVSNPIRRQIVTILANRGPQRVTEMTRELTMKDHTKLLFHIRNLKEIGIVQQLPAKSYYMGIRLPQAKTT